jgi:hypothetical protein
MISAMPLDELKTILLVGGFSESKLLQEGIQRHFPSIAVRTPSGPLFLHERRKCHDNTLCPER